MEYIQTPIPTERKPVTDYTLKLKIERLKRRLEKKLLARAAAGLLIDTIRIEETPGFREAIIRTEIQHTEAPRNGPSRTTISTVKGVSQVMTPRCAPYV